MLTLAASQDAGARRFYRPELNSLRFLAFALVFFEHAQPVGWVGRYADVGRFGVPVFFLLSAYLICTLLLREQQATGTVQVGAFMIRRILRIWPLYFVALLGSYLLSHTSLGVGMPHHMLLYFLLLMGNVFVGRYGWTNSPASILWSLSIEEQFYLVIPFVAKFLGRQGLRLVCWAALALGVLTLISFDLGDEADKNRVWVNSFVCFQFFALGGLIASGKERALSGKRLPLRGALLVAGLFCFLLASRSDALYSWRLPGPLLQSYAWGAAGTVALFYTFLGYPARPRSVTGYLGTISYGLYVFHAWCLELTVDFLDEHRWLVPYGRLVFRICSPLRQPSRWPRCRTGTSSVRFSV